MNPDERTHTRVIRSASVVPAPPGLAVEIAGESARGDPARPAVALLVKMVDRFSSETHKQLQSLISPDFNFMLKSGWVFEGSDIEVLPIVVAGDKLVPVPPTKGKVEFAPAAAGPVSHR